MKIHFAALIGVDYDLDLFNPWVSYYADRKFDSYTAVLHRENGDIPASVQSDYRNAGFRVLCVDGPFSIGCCRSAHLSNIAVNLPPDDMFVTADADEFQVYRDNTPIDYRYVCRAYDILHGLHEDRFSLGLTACKSDPFIEYPYAEEYTGEYLKQVKTPFIDVDHAPVLVRTKILAAPCNAPVEYKGSHCIKWVNTNQKVLLGLKVIHFAWREGAARKLPLKSYFSLDNIRQVFNGKLSDQMINNYNTIRAVANPSEDFLFPIQKGELSYGLQN
jgi:hypothetical protein